MFEITAETWKEGGINMRIIKNEENKLEIWLKIHDIRDKLGVISMSDLMIKEIKGIYNKEDKKKKNIKHRLMMDLCIFLVILL